MQTDFCLDRMKSVKHIRVDRMYQKKKTKKKSTLQNSKNPQSRKPSCFQISYLWELTEKFS